MKKTSLQILAMITILISIFYMKYSLSGGQRNGFFKLFSTPENAKAQ